MIEDHEERVLAVHLGRSANCSSIGSVVDMLFVSGVVGAALLSALAVMLRSPKGNNEPHQPDAEAAATEQPPEDSE
ncbi:MAG: hypothetical protein IPK60_08185 [Sandaracinaceae bacterium]|nr:hypothetical protein [Sandaracinaceae bacterium]